MIMDIPSATAGYNPRIATTTALGFWQSFTAAAFAAPPPIAFQPPPMRSHYYNNVLYPHNIQHQHGAQFLTSVWGRRDVVSSTSTFSFRTSTLFGFSSGKSIEKNDAEATGNEKDRPPDQNQPRIAIIGGGIAGVTAANALAKKFNNFNDNSLNAKIVVFEGDGIYSQKQVNFRDREQPTWVAATARNANSLVPGAAMHVMSQRTTLLKIGKDTVREWFIEKLESVQHWLHDKGHIDYQITKSIDNFCTVPPYFALHLFRCIGPSATWDERATFVTFLKQFLMTSLLSGEEEANQRGRHIQQLAKSNRVSFLEAINSGEDGKALATKIGLGKGFLSLHRTSEGAIHAANEGQLFGETSRILPLDDAKNLEPRIANLPLGDQLFVVHRINDYTANSAVFVQDLIKKVKSWGVEYRCGDIGMIEDISKVKQEQAQKSMGSPGKVLATAAVQQRQAFNIVCKDGSSHNFDYVVLAAGVNTPLFARKLSVGESCPTYPLRGYSLTIYTNHSNDKDSNGRVESGRSANLLNMPVSIDDMYCSSVGVNMARMAGFGELVGYRDKAVDVSSLAPRVLSRYAKTIFPESTVTEETALQCFRPCSPDDIPIVGEVHSVPGLFMHTGHGTLGWTLCLATSECLAQALHDDINGNDTNSTYHLPGDITVDRSLLSPSRFL